MLRKSNRALGYERVYLPLSKVADKPFQIQGDEKIAFGRRLVSTNIFFLFSFKVGNCVSNSSVKWFKNRNNSVQKERCWLFVLGLVLYYTEHCAACSKQTQTARVYQNADSSPSKHEDSTQCCFNVGPAPLAVGQYWNSIGSNARVCWELHTGVCLHPPLRHHNILASRSGYF